VAQHHIISIAPARASRINEKWRSAKRKHRLCASRQRGGISITAENMYGSSINQAKQ